MKYAYHPKTLENLCKLREALLNDCRSESRISLRAIVLGSLHGPLRKGEPSYFSNQCPRTFAPKPDYAVRFWKEKHPTPPYVEIVDLIKRKAIQFLSELPTAVKGFIIQGNSMNKIPLPNGIKFSWVITSPPYYGMRTYIQDQWLRAWFLGGNPNVPYGLNDGIIHNGAENFVQQLSMIWNNVAKTCLHGAKLVCRFGGPNGNEDSPLAIIKKSLKNTDWRIITVHSAGTAQNGKRQAVQFGERGNVEPRKEYDIYAILKA